jgi:RimJ/RimL family protein N-acetyltransferase
MKLEPQSAWISKDLELFLLEPALVGDDYVRWMNDPLINRYLESRFVPHSHDSVRAFVAAALANPDTLFLGIRHRELGKHVGNIKIELNRAHGLGEVGILIGEPAVHGRGIATQAIEMIAAVARGQLGLRKLTAGCYACNKGSQRAFVKAGFSVEAERPAHFLLDGKPEALVLMGLVL